MGRLAKEIDKKKENKSERGLTIMISKSLHTVIKAIAAKRCLSMKDYISYLLKATAKEELDKNPDKDLIKEFNKIPDIQIYL